jgi:ABC-type multidrug transport system fused ATPase/permease subunit
VDNKGFGGNPHCLTKEFSSICLEGLRKTTKIVSQDTWYFGRGSNRAESKPLGRGSNRAESTFTAIRSLFDRIIITVIIIIIIIIIIIMVLQPFVGPWQHFQCLNPVHSQ